MDEWPGRRNAIAHHDYSGIMSLAGRSSLPLAEVQSWRRTCDGLAVSFDEVMRIYIERMGGASPW